MPVPRRFLYDTRFALRMLRRQPTFTVAALLSLTLGITASIVIFTFVKALLMPVLPVTDAAGLVLIYSTTQDRARGLVQYQSTSYPNAQDYQSRNTVFSGLAVIVDSVCTLRRGNQSSQVLLNLTTSDYFDVLGIRPARGRAKTVRGAIEQALDLVILQRELIDGTRAMLGVESAPPDAGRCDVVPDL